jgi:hypothetical protein
MSGNKIDTNYGTTLVYFPEKNKPQWSIFLKAQRESHPI